jgi:hypothetical protein
MMTRVLFFLVDTMAFLMLVAFLLALWIALP